MLTSQASERVDLMGQPDHVAVERALSEFRCGRPVVMADEGTVVLPVDGMTDERLIAFRRLCAPAPLRLLVTERRARSLELATTGPVALKVNDSDSAVDILSLAADVRVKRNLEASATVGVAKAAIELAKLARRLPALLIANVASTEGLIEVEPDAVASFRAAVLATRFVVCRDGIGGTATAVIVGAPDFSRPVPVRMHSACLTGDVFGSRRCDCGDQLRLALARLDEEGGGVILYLWQEGRGLGLANKMRAYQLQDEGLDTLDANATLGFDDDERDYGIAVRMLELLGCKQVLLLTNNPAKLDGLTQAGIDVCGRIPLHTAINADNRRYLTAKATRAGHKLDHLLTVLAEDRTDDGHAPDR